MTIQQVDINKLQSYSGKTTKSFEQLIYTLMKKEYGGLGKFTPIAGDGGDSGVEFYLDLPNGEKWGWQCKWYGDNGRLSQSNRYASIENSLETTLLNHKNITKWFLCLRTNLTVSMKTKTGKIKTGEREWFETMLPLKIPAEKSVQIEFIGEDDIVNLIGDVKNVGVRNFFFGELEVNQQWFSSKFNDSFEQVKDKYEPELHTMDDYIQSIIDFKLLNPEYTLILDAWEKKLSDIETEIREELKPFKDASVQNANEGKLKADGLLLFAEFDTHKSSALEVLKTLKKNIIDYDILALTDLDFTGTYDIFHKYLDRLSKFSYSGNDSMFRLTQSPYFKIRNFFEELERFTRNYTHSTDNEIHFIAKPAEGKTHISCDIAYRRIQKDLPAIFLTGNKFNHETDLEQTILRQLDIPSIYSFEDLLTAIDIYGALVKVRIPIIIDGLNETINNKLFSDIWRTHLPSLASKIKRYQNLALITTCRKSYQDKVWGNYNTKTFQYLSGFDGYETTKEAIEKYFKRYHIKADLNFSNLDSFKKPIFLKLYCEIKNPQWQQGREVDVVIDDDSSNSLFETYFKQINATIALNSHLVRKNEPFIQNSLSKVAQFLWEKSTREIEVNQYYELIDGPGNYDAENSRAEILINEGLIITRDYRSDQEFISITYELASGYLIAKYLIESLKDEDFIPGGVFHQKIGTEDNRHPLYENIIEELALIFPKDKGKMLHDIYDSTDDNYIHTVSVQTLWKLQPEYINEKDLALVRDYFQDSQENRTQIIGLCMDTITSTRHPLNIHFLSRELLKLEVWERDLSWTEYVRESSHTLLSYIENFEEQSKTGALDSEISTAKMHLAAEYIQWFLVSTHRQLRDYSTRALYYYGRRYPENFTKMALSSLACNDPYLWERTLAALYGICMAEHHDNDFQQKSLPKIAKELYAALFRENAPHHTTHILARDYARGCIRIALIHNPKLLTEDQIKRVTPPYPLVQATLPMIEEGDNLMYRPPLGMDFSNYTIGYIVKGGGSYSDPPEKQMVRRQILHRIDQFGWSDERFKSTDKIFGMNHLNRHERPPIERYGKKYSRTAFYEIGGYRDDLGLLSKETPHYRISSMDLDPSFPEDIKTEKFVETDLLGDRSTALIDWLKTDEFPEVGKYLEPIIDENNQFVCLDGYIMQNDEQAHRERFVFLRSFLVKEKEYPDLVELLEKQHLGGRWLPEKHENTDAYAGEYYLFEEATYSNWTEMEFILSSEEKEVKHGEAGYFPDFKLKTSKSGSMSFGNNYPGSKTITVHQKKKFEVLMPVMYYHGPSDNKEINEASSTTILAKEIAMDLGLVERAQTFDLFDAKGALAGKNIAYHENSNNTHNMVYFRKDLLDKYLKKNKLKFLWAVWGERELTLGHRTAVKDNNGDKIQEYFVFQKIIAYQ